MISSCHMLTRVHTLSPFLSEGVFPEGRESTATRQRVRLSLPRHSETRTRARHSDSRLSQSVTSEAHAPRLAPSADTCGSGASPPATAAAASPSAAPKVEWSAAGCSTSCDLERSSRSSSVGAPRGSRLWPRKERCRAAGRERPPNQCARACLGLGL